MLAVWVGEWDDGGGWVMGRELRNKSREGMMMVRPAFDLTLAAALFLTAFMVPSASLACEPADPIETLDDPVVMGADCSFSNGGTYDQEGATEAVNVGGSVIGQKYYSGGACSNFEQLLVVDCGRGEAILIEGLEVDAMVGGGYDRAIAPLQRPQGPIGLTSKTTISGLAQLSDANGFTYTLNVLGLSQRESRRNQYDPFCGCKLFYPDSAGAQN
jgi:hypothetical protein